MQLTICVPLPQQRMLAVSLLFSGEPEKLDSFSWPPCAVRSHSAGSA